MSNFKPAKISRASIDAYIKKHGSKETIQTEHHCVTFKTADNETYHLDTTALILSEQLDEHKYLLGQTVPAHDWKVPLKNLAYIRKEDGSVENWTRDSKLMVDFCQLLSSLSLITIGKDEDDKPIVFVSQRVKSVIYKE